MFVMFAWLTFAALTLVALAALALIGMVAPRERCRKCGSFRIETYPSHMAAGRYCGDCLEDIKQEETAWPSHR